MGASVGTRSEDEPMMDINTTPLIDVMLVLLIMFIITIPIQTHAVKIDLPTPSDAPAPPIDPQRNKIAIDSNGAVLWNAQPVDLNTLRQYLELTTTIRPTPELHIQPHPEARYEVVDQVLAIVKLAQVQSMGFVGNEQYSSF
jgi:biopolymer transport protein ExbD